MSNLTSPPIVVDFLMHIGAEHWATPWEYLVEAGSFYMPKLVDEAITKYVAGQARGMNLRIPEVPALPEGYDYDPFNSRLALVHDLARMTLPAGMTEVDALRQIGDEECQQLVAILESGNDLGEFPFFQYLVQHHILTKAKSAGIEIVTKPGVFGYGFLAVRSFVKYHRDPDAAPSDDPRITDVYIVDSADEVHDPLGRTMDRGGITWIA